MIFFLFTCLLSWSYPLKNIQITEYEFKRYVKPNLQVISNSYESIVLNLSPKLKNHLKIANSFKRLLNTANELETDCSQSACEKKLYDLSMDYLRLLELFEIDLGIYTFEKIEYLELRHRFNKIKLQAFHNYVSLSRNKVAQLSDQGQAAYIKTIQNDIRYLVSSYHLFLIDHLPSKYHYVFKNYWNSFIFPLRKYNFYDGLKDTFIKNLTYHNTRINELTHYLTKIYNDTPRPVLIQLNSNHSRWNNILKISLEPLKK